LAESERRGDAPSSRCGAVCLRLAIERVEHVLRRAHGVTASCGGVRLASTRRAVVGRVKAGARGVVGGGGCAVESCDGVSRGGGGQGRGWPAWSRGGGVCGSGDCGGRERGSRRVRWGGGLRWGASRGHAAVGFAVLVKAGVRGVVAGGGCCRG